MSRKENIESLQERSNFKLEVGGNATILTGANLLITCPAEGVPPPSITWYRLRAELSSGGNVVIDKSTGSLNLLNVQTDDLGPYRCVAQNLLGSDRMTTHLMPIGLSCMI